MRAYLTAYGGRTAERVWPAAESAPGDDVARLRSVRVLDSGGAISDAIDRGAAVLVDVEYECVDGHSNPLVLLSFYNEEGICLFSSRSTAELHASTAGPARVRCRVPGDLFAEGLIRVHAALERTDGGHMHAPETEAVAFQVIDGSATGSGAGVLSPRLEWEAAVPVETV